MMKRIILGGALLAAASAPARADVVLTNQIFSSSPGVATPYAVTIQGITGGTPVPVTGTFSIGSSVSISNFPAIQPVSGTIAVSNFPAFPAIQPISAASLPLPAGASTSALQTAANASLTAIDTKTPPLGAALSAASIPVVVATDQAPIPVTGNFVNGSGRVVYSPLLGAAATYAGSPTAGIVVGGLQSLVSFSAINGQGTLNRIDVASQTGKTPNLAIYVYESAPAGCGADGTGFTVPPADLPKMIMGSPFLFTLNSMPGVPGGAISSARYGGSAMTVANHNSTALLYVCVVTLSPLTLPAADLLVSIGLDRY